MEKNGIKQIQQIFVNIIQQLLWYEQEKLNITIKYDWAPAVIYGRDPETKKLFLWTKGVFAKQAKKAYKEEDIKLLWKWELADKLLALRKEIKHMKIKNVVQWDLLYVTWSNDLKKMEIENEQYLTFRPNTIMYAVSRDSEDAEKLLASKLWLVNHTLYKADKEWNLKTDNNLPDIKLPETIWSPDLYPLFELDEKNAEQLTHIGEDIIKLNSSSVVSLHDKLTVLDKIIEKPYLIPEKVKNKKIAPYTPSIIPIIENYIIYTNKRIRDWKNNQKSEQIYDEFVSYYLDMYPDKIKKLSRPRDVICYERGYRMMKILLSRYKSLCVDSINVQQNIINHKYQLMDILSSSWWDKLNCFLPEWDSYINTNHEWYVVRDFRVKAAIKLVDRYAFSRANFIEPKLRSSKIPGIEWEKNKSVLMLFARMNPPTKKHIEIIRQMVDMANESWSDYMFFLSHTQDNNNPLSQDLKARIITDAVPWINIVRCGDQVSSLYDAVQHLAERWYKKVGVVWWADRMQTIAELQNRKDVYGFDQIVGINMGERKQGEDLSNMENISASKARQFAQKWDYKSFVKCFDDKISDELLKEAYEEIRIVSKLT